MVLPRIVKEKLAKKHRAKPIDSDKNTFEFPLFKDIKDAHEFVVGPLKWKICCLLAKGMKEKESKEKKPGKAHKSDDDKKDAPKKETTKIDPNEHYLQLKLRCCDLVEDMTVAVNGWAKMCPLKKGAAGVRDRSHSSADLKGQNHYQKKIDLEFSKNHDTITIYNLCPGKVVEKSYTDEYCNFKVVLMLRVIHVNFNRFAKFDFKQMGPTIKTPLSDVTFTIDHNNKTHTYAVNAQFVSMYSMVLAKKIADTEMIGDAYPPISLDGEFEPALMRDFLSFIYPCHRPIKNGNVAATLEMAKRFDAPSIIELCQRYLVDNIDSFTNLQMLRHANKADMPQVAALILRKLDTAEGAKKILEKLEASGEFDERLKAAIQRHADHPDRFKRHFPQRCLDQMETQKAEKEIDNRPTVNLTLSQINQRDDRRKKKSANCKLRMAQHLQSIDA